MKPCYLFLWYYLLTILIYLVYFFPIQLVDDDTFERNETEKEIHETEIQFEQKYHCLDCNKDFDEDDINHHCEEFEHYRIEKVEPKKRKNHAKRT